jgi:hypothetical protein
LPARGSIISPDQTKKGILKHFPFLYEIYFLLEIICTCPVSLIIIAISKYITSFVPKKASQLCVDTDVYRHVLAIGTSVSRKIQEAFFFWNGGSTKKEKLEKLHI